MNLPETWMRTKMPDVVEWSSGGTPKSDNQKYYNGNIPWLIIGDLTDTVVYYSATNITELGMKESSAKYVEEGSVLLAMYGSIGKLGIAGTKLTTNQAIAFTKTLNGINNWYLFYYLQLIKPKLFSLSKGGTQKNISLTVVNSLSVPLPPLPEQRRIVAKIDSLFSELDNGVTLLKTIKTQFKIYRQAVLRDVFNRFSETSSIMKITSLVTSGSRGWAKYYSDSGAKFIRIGNLTRDGIKIDLTDVQCVTLPKKVEGARSLLVEGDILISITADLGSIGYVEKDFGEAYINQHIALARFRNKIQSKFYAWFLRSDKGQIELLKNKRGAGKLGLGLDDIRNTKVPIVTDEEALYVLQEIESRLSVCDKLEQTIDQTLALSASLRQSILKKAFEGRLVPQDPNDEPAEKLLERIKAEKAAVLAKQKQTRKRGRK